MKKYYTFVSSDGEVKIQVVAENHVEAIEKANAWRDQSDTITQETDYYFESYE